MLATLQSIDIMLTQSKQTHGFTCLRQHCEVLRLVEAIGFQELEFTFLADRHKIDGHKKAPTWRGLEFHSDCLVRAYDSENW